MSTSIVGLWLWVSRGGRGWRVVPAVASVFALAFWQASAAAAATIHVTTTLETATFNNPGPGGGPNQQAPPRGPTPTYFSAIDGDSPVSGKCSLREAINSANNAANINGGNQPIGSCEVGTGNDTIVLDPGTYGVYDNFFIGEKMTFLGPNEGVPGNAPLCSGTRRGRRPRAASCRGPEAELSFDYNPNYAAQVSMFWLDSRGSGVPSSEGAGTVFDGLVLQGGFVPTCGLGLACEIVGIVQPTQGVVETGYTLTDSILRDFSFGVYLGGTDTITRNLFESMNQSPDSPANGNGIYSDGVYTSQNSHIEHNVFNNPNRSGVIIQGDANRGTVDGAVIADNVFLKQVNTNLGANVINTTGVVIKNNLFLHRNPKPLPDRRDAAILLDKDTNIQITGNTIVGWQRGISIGPIGNPGPPGSTDITVAFNRIWNNTYGFRVTPSVLGGTEYGPLAVDANDNWWGSNGGPGTDGGRPGAINPVNGVQFFASGGTTPVPNPGGITVDRWLHLTCTVPSTVTVNVPAPVVGQDVGMPTVDVFDTVPPWFVDDHQPLMAGSAPGLGDVYGFDRVPNEGPDNAQLTGTLVATHAGSGDVLVDLDSQRVDCPLTAEPGPEPDIGKDADSPTVTAGGLEGYRITVTNRGRVTARNWWVCDRMPRRMTFVRATRKLRRLGRMRCLVIARLRPHHRASFHVTLRVASNAPNGTETNIAEVIPGLPPAPAEQPGVPAVPDGQPPAVQIPIKSDRVKVKVRRRAQVRPPAPRPPLPPFTG